MLYWVCRDFEVGTHTSGTSDLLWCLCVLCAVLLWGGMRAKTRVQENCTVSCLGFLMTILCFSLLLGLHGCLKRLSALICGCCACKRIKKHQHAFHCWKSFRLDAWKSNLRKSSVRNCAKGHFQKTGGPF